MRPSRPLLAGAVLALAIAATPAGAAILIVPVDFTPTEGPPGTVVTVQGNCAVDFSVATVEGDEWDITAMATSPDASTTVEGSVTVPTEDGDWSIDLTIPDSAVPGDEWDIDADCTFVPAPKSAVENQGGEIPYETGTFLVTEPPTTTTTEAATTTTTTEATTTTAAVAPVVAAAPSFTG